MSKKTQILSSLTLLLLLVVFFFPSCNDDKSGNLIVTVKIDNDTLEGADVKINNIEADFLQGIYLREDITNLEGKVLFADLEQGLWYVYVEYYKAFEGKQSKTAEVNISSRKDTEIEVIF